MRIDRLLALTEGKIVGERRKCSMCSGAVAGTGVSSDATAVQVDYGQERRMQVVN